MRHSLDSIAALREVQLTPKQIAVLAWTFYEGWSQREIAHRLNITQQSVQGLFARGCAKLQEAGYRIPDRPDGGDGSAWDQTMTFDEMDKLTPAEIVGVA